MHVAIVGGGVSGCYCAYRLSQAHPEWDIQLFEASARIGGRLWSVPLTGLLSDPPAELGGMFISDKHHNLFRLLKHLGLDGELDLLDIRKKHQYLRAVNLKDATYVGEPEKVPFKLRDDEKGKVPGALLFHALELIVPGLPDMWPLKADASPGDTFEFIRTLHHRDGRPLWECGFWNVLNDVMSHEAYALLMDTIGQGSIFRNANAAESVWTLLRELDRSQNYYRLKIGYQAVPLTMLARAQEKGVGVHMEHTLREIRRDQSAFMLRFTSADGETIARAEKVILALPRRTLQVMAFDDALFSDAAEFRSNLDGVLSAPACKVFMTYDEPWWDPAKFDAAASDAVDDVNAEELTPTRIRQSFTDMPMRQCYYYGKPKSPGRAMIMAAYTDDVATSFWLGLEASAQTYSNPAVSPADQQATICSSAVVASAARQLKLMHDLPAAPLPTHALFVYWGKDTYGAGWHHWAPNCRSWVIGPKIRQPNPKLDLFICGEAYSQRQGWVEGAINSAEMALHRLGLKQPCWLADLPDFVFEVEGEPDMKQNRLMELVVALGESLALQRAYARDREAIMTAFDLNDVEKAAMRTGNAEKVKVLACGGSSVGVFISTVSSSGSDDT